MTEPETLVDSGTSEASGRVQGSTLTVEVPPEWFFKESITILAPDGQANVIASTEPLDDSIDVETYAQVQGDLLRKEFPGYRETTFTEIGIMGVPGPVYFREFAWTPPDGVEVSQMQIYAVHKGRGITATATTPTSSYARFRDVMGEIILSLVHAPSQSIPAQPTSADVGR